MKDWLIKKLGGFTKDEYINKRFVESEPRLVIKSAHHIERHVSRLEFYNGEENRFTSEDIRYELMRILFHFS